jgi:hypothetical protein
VASSAWYWLTDSFTGAPAGQQAQEQAMQPVEGLGPGAGQLVAAVHHGLR